MFIVSIEKTPQGFHVTENQPWRDTVWQVGYIEVPVNLREVITDCMGYCDLIIENGVLIGVIPGEPPPLEIPDMSYSNENEQLKEQITALQLALCEVYETLTGGV